jgi:predicted double-glycine peptidase
VSDLPARCVVASAAWSGAAALATVSAQHGVTVDVGEIAELTYTQGLAVVEEGTVLVMARALGFEATAMEGGYGDLPDVTLPLLVALREGESDRYAVLFAFDDEGATVGDPLTGEVTPWTRERFCALWTGSVVQVLPIEEERRALAARLVELRDGVKRVLRAVGWTRPYGPKYAMLAAWVVLVAVVFVAPRANALDAWTVLVAAACAGSLWSWVVVCPLCSRARQLAGDLPLAQAGALFYGALLVSAFAPVPAIATTLALGAAVGAHVALVSALARAKLACPPCLFVAACALGAGVLSVSRDNAHAVHFVVAALAAGAALVAALPAARARQARVWRANADALAKGVLAEPRAEGGLPVRVVAYKRAGCGACAFFEAAVKPALLATFDDAITLEERDLANVEAAAPLVVIVGKRTSLFIGLPDDNASARFIDAVREAIEGEPLPDAPMSVHFAG